MNFVKISKSSKLSKLFTIAYTIFTIFTIYTGFSHLRDCVHIFAQFTQFSIYTGIPKTPTLLKTVYKRDLHWGGQGVPSWNRWQLCPSHYPDSVKGSVTLPIKNGENWDSLCLWLGCGLCTPKNCENGLGLLLGFGLCPLT